MLALPSLHTRYEASTSKKKALEDELSDLEGKLERAEKLVTGLAGERIRWEASIGDLEQRLGFLPGDVVMASAFMSYAGPFPSEYRYGGRVMKHTVEDVAASMNAMKTKLRFNQLGHTHHRR